MAIISEELDKKEEEHQNLQNPKQEDEDDHLNQNPLGLPVGIIEVIIARVSRFDYPSVSFTSRFFRHMIYSQELFKTRSCLGFTEPVMYALIAFSSSPPNWFILRRRSNTQLGLSRVVSLPSMRPGCVVVPMKHNIYVMGGCDNLGEPVKDTYVIDCRNQTCQKLADLQRGRRFAAAGVIEGNIYVIGGCEKDDNNWVEVLDVTRGVWLCVPGPCPINASSCGIFGAYAVIKNRIWMLDTRSCLTYEPSKGTWETWGGTVSHDRYYCLTSCCVVDGLLVSIDITYDPGHPIKVCDPSDMLWRSLMGVDSFEWPILSDDPWAKMGNVGGRLVILASSQGTDVDCIEITLQRHEDGSIWGDVKKKSCVHSFPSRPLFELSRTVIF